MYYVQVYKCTPLRKCTMGQPRTTSSIFMPNQEHLLQEFNACFTFVNTVIWLLRYRILDVQHCTLLA
jgi:hypothetical protein